MSESNGDTLKDAQNPETPGASANTPPNGGSQPSGDQAQNEVEREKARAATAQRERDEALQEAKKSRREIKILNQKLAALAGTGDEGGDGGSQTPPSGNTEAIVVQARAERRVVGLVAGDAKYTELLASDPTLKDILLNNPLSIIKNYIDEDDAVEQVQDYLDRRLASRATTTPAPAQATPPAQDATGKDIPRPGTAPANGGVMRYSAEQIKNMPASEWMKIPAEQRQKMMQGDFS